MRPRWGDPDTRPNKDLSVALGDREALGQLLTAESPVAINSYRRTTFGSQASPLAAVSGCTPPILGLLFFLLFSFFFCSPRPMTCAVMKIHVHAVRKVAIKRKRALEGTEGPSGRQRTQAPSRSPTRSPPPLEHEGEAAVGPAIDLMADTPPEGARAKGVAAATKPAVPAAESKQAEVEPGSGEGSSTPRRVSEGHPMATEVLAEEVPPATGSAPTALDPAEATKGGEVEAVPSRPSVMNHGRRVERLITQIVLPEF